MEPTAVRVLPGTRVGFWHPGPHAAGYEQKHKHAFQVKGVYVGPDLGDHIPGTKLQQPLMEGELKLRVGVLFRPDLGKKQKLETILILENFIPEMFQYEHWEALTG
jgi:hypothetical protein